MNISSLSRIVCVVALLIQGCGPAELPFTDSSQDSLAYAQDVKILVVSAARKAKSSSEPLDFLAPALSELKQTDRPVGEFRSIYDELRKKLEGLVADSEKSGKRAAKLAQRLDELAELAQTLPDALPASPVAK